MNHSNQNKQNLPNSNLNKDLFEYNWYEVLELDVSSTTDYGGTYSSEIISKTIRKLSLKYHPDKSSDPKAPAIFLLIQKAKEILLDEEKRKIVDNHIQAIAKRKEYDEVRDRTMDDKRKKMKADLEERMKSLNKVSSVSMNIQSHRNNEMNMNDLRKETQKKRDEFSNFFANVSSKAEDASNDYLQARQIKVKWKAHKQSHSDDSLFQLFKIYGDIQDVKLYGDKGNAAIITYNDTSSCIIACSSYIDSKEFRVTKLDDGDVKKKAKIFTHNYSSEVRGNQMSSQVESTFANDAKRAAERQELLRKLYEEENQESSSKHSHKTTNTTEYTKDSFKENTYEIEFIENFKNPYFDEPMNGNISLEYLREKEKAIFRLVEQLMK